MQLNFKSSENVYQFDSHHSIAFGHNNALGLKNTIMCTTSLSNHLIDLYYKSSVTVFGFAFLLGMLGWLGFGFRVSFGLIFTAFPIEFEVGLFTSDSLFLMC